MSNALQLPKGRPFLRVDGQREGCVLFYDGRDFVAEIEVFDVRLAADPFAVDAHQIALGVVIDHGLVALPLGVRA